MGVDETTDQLRTTTAEFSASQRSTMRTSDKRFTRRSMVGTADRSELGMYRVRVDGGSSWRVPVDSPRDRAPGRRWTLIFLPNAVGRRLDKQ